MRQLYYGLVLGTLLLAPLSASALITNGSFETGDFTGWSATGNATVGFDANRASDGSFFIPFNSGSVAPNGVLTQAISVNLGEVFELRFDFGKFSNRELV